MFGLRNELFGFPVNSCDYENIECNKSYVPILNWDNDNEFVWSLGDPIDGGVDASNVTFNSKDIQKRPASIKKVDEALEHLMDKIDQSKSSIQSFEFALNEDGETLEGTITYEDDSGATYAKTASINLKNIVEGWETLTLKDITADSIDADTGTFDNATIGGLDVTGDAVIEGNETVNGTVVMNSTLDVAGKATINGGADITGNLNVLEDVETHEGGEIHSKSLETTEDVTIGGDLSVTGDTTIGGDTGISGNITSAGSANIGGALTVDSTANIGSNLTVGGNTEISGDTTIGGDTTIDGITTVAKDLNIGGDVTISDDLIVNGSSHLNTFETTGSGSIGGNLSVDGSIAGGSNLVVENQIESGSLVTTNITTDNLTVNGNIALGNNATAPDFVLQSEKGQANGVAPLNANGKIDAQYLPPVYTTAIVKMGTGVFSNSNTSTIVDEDITADSFVILSNYSDIIGDLNEVINIGQITVASNEIETGSYKYIIVNPLPSNS